MNPGLYLHIPFCRNKCPYCGFYSVASVSLVSRWLEALQKEILHYKDRFGRFDSLYIGGGTPTCLDLDSLNKLMETLLAHFDFAPDTERTFEANPGDLTREKIAALRALGFNRVSLGVQAFDDHTLSFLGRTHTALDAEKALLNLRSSGFNNIGVDLIYAYEGQTAETWKQTLEKALSFQPEHLSCYQLTFEEKTVFCRKKQQGIIKPLTEKEEAALFVMTSTFLKDRGYIHYEISNFAREEKYASRHNRKYWQHIPYLGLGPSAHSFQDTTRWWNVRSIRAYCKTLESGRAPIEGHERLTIEQLELETVSLGSRTMEGFDLREITQTPLSVKILSKLQDAGFITVEDGHVLPTQKGFLVADHLPHWFVPNSSC
jgi:oxygen-independent coproporphyrinogen-3 oxidase